MSLLSVENLVVEYPVPGGVFRAVDGVSFAVEKGSTLAVVGESGCGKSTIAKAIVRLLNPTSGRVMVDGVDIARLSERALRPYRSRIQMVFQDPYGSLDPHLTAVEIVGEPLRLQGIRARSERDKRAASLIDRVGLPSTSLRRRPAEFSGGQRQRIGIARALASGPELLVCDEATSALDVSVQAQVLNLLQELQERLGLTYLVIAHDLAVVRHISDVVGVMYLGSLVEQAPADDLYEQPLHPYTRALMSAVPVPDPVVEERRERILLAGDLPSPANPPSGCRFHTRCPWRQETRCDDEVPVLRELAPGRLVSCHWAEDIRDGLLFPKSVEEVAATQGVTIAATGAEGFGTDSPVGGIDQPIERT
jgi:peptide/nickel transport system ATP-binding protein